jgi:hypothetical protein
MVVTGVPFSTLLLLRGLVSWDDASAVGLFAACTMQELFGRLGSLQVPSGASAEMILTWFERNCYSGYYHGVPGRRKLLRRVFWGATVAARHM